MLVLMPDTSILVQALIPTPTSIVRGKITCLQMYNQAYKYRILMKEHKCRGKVVGYAHMDLN